MTGMWDLPYAVPDKVRKRAAVIRLAVFDVDGVLTDGSLLIGPDGEERKSFHTHDGHGLKLLHAAGIETGVITARNSRALAHRLQELNINHHLVGRADKLAAFTELAAAAGIPGAACSDAGDDVVDLPVLLRCGLAVTVPGAHHLVRRVAHWVTPSAGGAGAVREICELLLYSQNKLDSALEQYLT